MKNKNYRTIQLPNLDIVEGESGLMAFYEALGYDKESKYNLRPMDVLLNPEDRLELLQRFKECFKEGNNELSKDHIIGINLIFMNNGPSQHETVMKGTVKLVDGWDKGE